jgi:MFS family permease
MAGLKFVFRALAHRNYRLFFGGQSISLVGTWMQQIAMSWLVYRLTHSAFLLGVVVFLGQIPTFLFTPFTGVLADRYNRHRILIVTQVLSMAQACVLSILVLTGRIFLGVVNSLDIPVRHSFIAEMITGKEDLGNAIALNSTMFNMARLLGPSLGGILIAAFGEGVCFLLNAVSYAAVIASLLLMKIAPRKVKTSEQHVLHELKEGLTYVLRNAAMRNVLMPLGLVSLMGVPYQVLMPVFARDIFHGGPKTLGFLMAMAGCGALLGALNLAARENAKGLGRVISGATACFGIAIIIFSFSRALWFSLVVICAAGFSIMVMMASANTILQTLVDEDKRGRVMSFYAMAFMGMVPFGSLIAGSLAQRIGAPATLMLGGVCCVGATALFARRLSS